MAKQKFKDWCFFEVREHEEVHFPCGERRMDKSQRIFLRPAHDLVPGHIIRRVRNYMGKMTGREHKLKTAEDLRKFMENPPLFLTSGPEKEVLRN
jgi:hypothetical protein